MTEWNEIPSPSVHNMFNQSTSWWAMRSFNGDIHFVSRHHDYHLVWNQKEENVKEIVLGRRERDSKWQNSEGGTAIHIASKDMILQLGGLIHHVHGERDGERDMVDEVLKGEVGEDGKWHWEVVKARGQRMAAVNAVVTSNGKYVIITYVDLNNRNSGVNEPYTLTERKWLQYVHVIGIEDGFKWRRTEIKNPLPEPPGIFRQPPNIGLARIFEFASNTWRRDIWNKQIVFRTGNGYQIDLVVEGFVKRHYRKFKNMSSMPRALIGLIVS